MLLFGPFGGLVADRFDKRQLLYVTQTAGGLLALTLGMLDVTHLVRCGRSTCSPPAWGSSICSTTRPARPS